MATHSPILICYPGAQLVELTEDGINTLRYQKQSTSSSLSNS